MQEFQCPSKIVTGDGSAGSLGTHAESLGMKRIVLVTDKGLRDTTEFVTSAVASLKASGIPADVFDEVGFDFFRKIRK